VNLHEGTYQFTTISELIDLSGLLQPITKLTIDIIREIMKITKDAIPFYLIFRT
jgi:hypothetical protein